MVNQNKWTIFLSYSNKDREFADWLYFKLHSANFKVWFDKYEILIGDSIVKKIGEGLEGSEMLMVIISRQAVKSNWVSAELEPKILQQISDQKISILPIILGRIDPGKISTFLKGKRYMKFPQKGSDEAFRELLRGIQGHLKDETDICYTRNPFGFRGGVEPQHFIVVDRFVREITEAIVKKQSLSLVGARMMGKTSLLKFLASHYCQPYYRRSSSALRFAFLDLQEHTVKNCDQLLPELARSISKYLPIEDAFLGNTHEAAKEWIKRTYPQETWVFLIDEFDRVDELDGLDKTLFDQYRHLAQHSHVCFVIASRRKLIDLPLSQSITTSPFFNLFIERVLTVWDESTVQVLMKKYKFFTEKDITSMIRLTACHPMLIEMGCFHLFNAYHETSKKASYYDEVLYKYMDESESMYRYYWNHEIDDTEREWLLDCWQAELRKDKIAMQELQSDTERRKNYKISRRLMGMGLILNELGSIELPIGFQAFLENCDH